MLFYIKTFRLVSRTSLPFEWHQFFCYLAPLRGYLYEKTFLFLFTFILYHYFLFLSISTFWWLELIAILIKLNAYILSTTCEGFIFITFILYHYFLKLSINLLLCCSYTFSDQISPSIEIYLTG